MDLLIDFTGLMIYFKQRTSKIRFADLEVVPLSHGLIWRVISLATFSFSLLPLLASLQEVPQLLDSSAATHQMLNGRPKGGVCLPKDIRNDAIGANKTDVYKITIRIGFTISKAVSSPTKVI